MPDKEGSDDEKKSTKSVVNKRQKQMLNQEDYLPEEGYDIARDMGRVRPSKDKKDATTMPVSDEVKKTQKVNKGPSAFERVKAKYGKSVMKVEELDLTKVAESFGGTIVEVTRITGDNYKKFIKNIKKGEPPIGDIRNPDSAYDYNQLTGKEKEEYMNIKKEFGGSKRQKPQITGDSGQRDRARVTFGQGQEPKKRAPRKGVDYFADPPDVAKAKREKTAAKRDEYEIDDKGNVTDAGVEKFARRSLNRKQIASGSNEPIKLSKSDLATAREKLVGGTEVKDSKGKVIGKTTGKYGGTMSPQASEKEMKQTQAYLKKRGLTKGFTGDKPPTKDDIKPPSKKEMQRMINQKRFARIKRGAAIKSRKFLRFVKRNPLATAIGVSAGKDTFFPPKIGLPPMPKGGTVGKRTAG